MNLRKRLKIFRIQNKKKSLRKFKVTESLSVSSVSSKYTNLFKSVGTTKERL